MRNVVQLFLVKFLAPNTILLMRTWNHACSFLVYVILSLLLIHYSWKAARATAFRRYYLLKNKLSDRMKKQL